MVLPTMVQADEGENVYYYILVDRFESGDIDQVGVNLDDPEGFHGGDFQGIENRIDHLATLGVTHIILSPVFQTNDYTGVNVTSYEKIQETFGTKEDLSQLIQSLNDQNMEVLLHFPITDNLTEDEMINHLQAWKDGLPISGYYFSDLDKQPDATWQRIIDEVDSWFMTEVTNNPEKWIQLGFDRVVDRSVRDEAVNFLKDFDQPLEPLLNATDWSNGQIVQSMDLYDTDRFTHSFAATGSHPITHWKLAITYLMTTANEPLFYQGTEIPLDGVTEDLSHHQTVNFLAGDDQLIRHIEKISNAYDDLPSLAKGEFELLHADDGYLVFKRTYKDETTIVAINNSSSLQKVDIELEPGLELRGLLIDDLVREKEEGIYTVAAERESSNIFMVQNSTGIYWPLILIFGGIMAIFVTFTLVMYRKNKK